MTSRLLALVGNDARMQYRYGIYVAYGFVVALYVAVLVWGGPWLPAWVPALIVFTDPAALGFFFLGALMMLEQAERVRTALAVAPVTPADYFLAKAITLGGLTLAACTILLFAIPHAESPALLLAATALTSVAYVGIGTPIALRFRTVNGYLIGAGALLAPVITPGFLALLDPMPIWVALIPPVSQFRLMLVATGAAAASAVEIAIMLSVCAVTAAGCVWLAVRALARELGR